MVNSHPVPGWIPTLCRPRGPGGAAPEPVPAAGQGGRALAPGEGRSGAGRGAPGEAALQEGKGLRRGGEGLSSSTWSTNS